MFLNIVSSMESSEIAVDSMAERVDANGDLFLSRASPASPCLHPPLLEHENVSPDAETVSDEPLIKVQTISCPKTEDPFYVGEDDVNVTAVTDEETRTSQPLSDIKEGETKVEASFCEPSLLNFQTSVSQTYFGANVCSPSSSQNTSANGTNTTNSCRSTLSSISDELHLANNVAETKVHNPHMLFLPNSNEVNGSNNYISTFSPVTPTPVVDVSESSTYSPLYLQTVSTPFNPNHFPGSLNPFSRTLPPAFLPQNVFLSHPLTSPAFNDVMNLSNSWRFLNAYARINSRETPSSGLSQPTPTFPELPPTLTPHVTTESGTPSFSFSEASRAQAGRLEHVKDEDPAAAAAAAVVSSKNSPPAADQLSSDGTSNNYPCKLEHEHKDLLQPDKNIYHETRDSSVLYRVRWSEHSSRICSYVASLHGGDDESADMYMVTKAGDTVPAHRLVMAAASPMLMRILKKLPWRQTAIIVPCSSADALEALVSLCYTGNAKLSKTLLPQVLKIAEELEITHLNIELQDCGVNSSSSVDTSSTQPLDYRLTSCHTNNAQQDSSTTASSPSPPSIFTFTPPPPAHSPPSYSSALMASSASLARTSTAEKRRPHHHRPLTPDLTHTERAKKVKTGATFLPREALEPEAFGTATSGAESSRNKSAGAGCSATTTPSLPNPVPLTPFPQLHPPTPSTPRDAVIVPTGRSNSFSGTSCARSRVLLWKFLLQLLHDARFCPVYIRWLDRSNGVFRIMESDMVAQLWGIARKNRHMNYEKMSRGMRTYYKRHIMYHIDGTKLIYKFNTSELEVQNHMRFLELSQQTLDENPGAGPNCGTGSDAANALCSRFISSTNPLSNISDSCLEHLKKMAKNDENARAKFHHSSSSTEPQTAACLKTSVDDTEELGLRESVFSTPLSLPTLMPSFPGMPTLSSMTALPNLASHALAHSLARSSSTANLAKDKGKNKGNANEGPSLNRLELLGMNKPRSNSIPNFQTSSRFASFFTGASSGATGNSSSNKNSSSIGVNNATKTGSLPTTASSLQRQSPLFIPSHFN
uniref:Friend leukemia integration 1 transcription factor-like n=1 Tax=Hirondellea gigas TaxID=1518452 RepID=A0A6A7G3R1_9CRUS